MAMKDLAEKTTPQGAVTAVWHDDEEDTIVVQYEFVHLSFYKPEFKSFVETLNEALKKIK